MASISFQLCLHHFYFWCIVAFFHHSQAIRNIQYSFFKKSYLAAVSDDGGLYLWDTNSTKLLVSFSNAHKAPATDLSFSPLNNLLLASCGLDKKILCYDVMGKKWDVPPFFMHCFVYYASLLRSLLSVARENLSFKCNSTGYEIG